MLLHGVTGSVWNSAVLLSWQLTDVQSTGKDEQQMKIKLGNCQLEQCQEFVYLAGSITQDASCDKDVDKRIGLAAGIV